MEGILGEIRSFAGNFAPVNWLICNGATLPINNYQALYSLLGNRFGGDGITTFGIPDLRGRLALGQGTGIDPTTGQPLTQRIIGSTGGSESVVLSDAQLTPHNHTVETSTVATGSVSNPSSATYLGPATIENGTAFAYLPGSATGFTMKIMDENMIQPTGGNQAHNNIMPCIAINYIICVLGGVYPPRS